jgi:hypothetical protein
MYVNERKRHARICLDEGDDTRPALTPDKAASSRYRPGTNPMVRADTCVVSRSTPVSIMLTA